VSGSDQAGLRVIKSHMIMEDAEQVYRYLEQVLRPNTKFVMDSLLFSSARLVFRVRSVLDQRVTK